jgi:RpiR family carbohydrate utilization transcriptional regulator
MEPLEAARAADLGGRAFLARVQACEPSLRESDRDIVAAILADPERLVRSSVSDLATFAGTAQSSVVRTCQRLGYRGFQDLKMAVARDLSRQPADLAHPRGIDETTPTAAVAERVFAHSGHALLEASATIDPAAFEGAVEHLCRARHIAVIGNGTSAAPAHDCAYRLTALGRLAHNPSDPHAQHLVASQLGPADCCIAISHTGATRETLQVARAAGHAGAFVVAITSFLRSPLTELADAPLVAGAPEQSYRQQSTTSRLAHLALIDALFVAVALREPSRTTAALDATEQVRADHTL